MNQPAEPDTFVSVREACRRFKISRRTFYRMLEREPGLREIVVRVPPRSGRLKIPLRRLERWLREQQ